MASTEDSAMRPFRFNASDEALADLRRRVAGTKWPSRELVTDASQGVQRATLSELARFFPESARAKVLKSGVLKEARATFTLPPGEDDARPAQKTAIPGAPSRYRQLKGTSRFRM